MSPDGQVAAWRLVASAQTHAAFAAYPVKVLTASDWRRLQVNTASRMESTSVPGRIQCSAAAAALIRAQAHEITLRPRSPASHRAD